jgi:hypothetical protein
MLSLRSCKRCEREHVGTYVGCIPPPAPHMCNGPVHAISCLPCMHSSLYTHAAAPAAWVAHCTRMHTDAPASPCTRKQLPPLHAQCPVACKRAHVVSYEHLLAVHDPEPMSYMRPHAFCTLHAHTMTAVPTSTLPAICATHHDHVPLKCNRRLVERGYVRARLCIQTYARM